MEYKFTVANFDEEVLKSELPVLVDFYADWCNPCKMMAPVVERIAEEYEGRLKVGKCDVSANMPLAQKYRVSNIPAFMIFKGGEPVDSFVGALSADDLCDRIDANL
ncbi:MAG: thioredoxin [Lachnospiraceae bacterium]|nr:thioredoxin [Lachnospiraceae bacterium]